MANYLTPKLPQVPKLDLKQFKKQEPTKTTYDPKKQLEGYQKRLEASGIDPQEATDSRNWLEKALNLTPDQNVFFDIFEILERPQQALFGAWKASQEGKDVKEAMKAGISGNDVVRFKEILHNYGMSDSEKKFGVDDVVGFLGDIFIDPIEIPMIVATGGSSAIAKATAKADDAADLVKTLSKAVDAGKASKETLEAAVKAAKVADSAVDAASKTRLISPIEGLFRVTKKGAGVGVKIADKGITKVLTKVDDLAAAGYKGTDAFKDALNLADTYKNAKKRIQQIFNAAKEIPVGIMEKFRLNIGKNKRLQEQLRIVHGDFLTRSDDLFEAGIKTNLGITSDEFYEAVGDVYEAKNYKPTVKMKEILYSKNLDVALDEETYQTTLEFFRRYIPEMLDENIYKIDDLFVKSTLENGQEIYRFNDKYIPEIRNKLDDLDPTYKQRNYTFEEYDIDGEEIIDDMAGGVVNDVQKTPEPTTPTPTTKKPDLKQLDKSLSKLKKANPHIADDIQAKISSLANKNLTDAQIAALKANIDDYVLKAQSLKDTGMSMDNIQQMNRITKDFRKYIDDLVAGADDIVDDVFKATNELVPFTPKTRKTITKGVRETIEETMPLQDFLELEMKSPRFYSDDDLARFDRYLADPNFNKAVTLFEETQTKMLDMIDEIMGTALKNGTPEGYLRHALSKERRAIPMSKRLEFEELVASGLKGNVNEFTGRKYRVSKYEANMIYRDKIKKYIDLENLPEHKRAFWEGKKGMDLFERSVNSSIADFIDSAPTLAKDLNQLDDVLISATLRDENILRPLQPDEKVMSTHKQVSRADITGKLKGMKKYVSEETGKRFDEFIKGLPAGDRFAMDATVYEMIGRLGKKDEISLLYKLMDMINNTFKKWKLFSPGFQMRNFLGNSTNMYLAGMSPDDIAIYFKKADDVLKQAPDLLKKATLNGVDSLSAAEKALYTKYINFVDKNFLDLSSDVYDVRTVVKTNKKLRNKYDVLGKAADFNFAVNQKADNRFRMAMLDWATENPDKIKKMGFASPEEAVRHALFDPEDLSGFEKEKIKRLIPFYTFTKKNLAFQAKNIFENPTKYNHLRKTIRATWEEWANIKDTDIESYKRENFWIPVPFLSKDGKYAAIKTNLPLGDLAEFVENPGKKIMASMSPMIRAPFELATNKQIYTDMPIQEFKGQQGYLMPFLDRKPEYGISQFGLDVPMSLGADLVRTAGQGIRGELQGKSAFDIAQQSIGRSILSSGSVEKAQTSKSYEQLRQIQDLMKYYKQEGIDIITLAEAENKNSSLNNLQARLRAIVK
jgi:hypothetical protein